MDNQRLERARYPRSRASVGKARSFARAIAEKWELQGISDDLELIVSELVTNAVIHAKTGNWRQVGLTVDQDSRRVRIEVRDTGDGLPRQRRDAETYAETGRGINIVQAVSSSWGVTEQVIGKTVWAEILTTSETSGP